MQEWHLWVATIAGLVTIIGGLNSMVGLPFRRFLLFSKHKVVRVSGSGKFSVEAIKDSQKITINSGDSFSYRFGIPISIRGKTQLPDIATVWVVLSDQFGGYYLQNPPVVIRSGEWVATNIRPLQGIRRLIFSKTNAQGDEFFARKVKHAEWGKFESLPDGTTEIAFVELE